MISADFLRLAHRVADAAEGRLTEEREILDEELGPPVDAFRVLSVLDLVRAYDGRAVPRAAHLRATLEALDVETLRRLVAVMYSGRDDEEFRDVLRDPWVARMDHREAVRTLEAKGPLGRYLRRGIARLTSPRGEDRADA